jgi:hypothetical protein
MVTFDWGQVTFIGSPLPVPWWAIANIGIAMVIFYWIVTPIIYVSTFRVNQRFYMLICGVQYTNTWFTAYLPMVSSNSFDNTGNVYNVTRIINPDLSLNEAEYQAYSPLFLPAAFAISYGLSFASITATLMHTFLYYRKQIWTQARRSLGEQPDGRRIDSLLFSLFCSCSQLLVHARLMSVYRIVPDWWYGVIFGEQYFRMAPLICSQYETPVTMFVFGIIVIEVFHTDFPVWAFVIALMICTLICLPLDRRHHSAICSFRLHYPHRDNTRCVFVLMSCNGCDAHLIIKAITNQQVGLSGFYLSCAVLELLLIHNLRCANRIDYWLHAAWSTSCHDDVQE